MVFVSDKQRKAVMAKLKGTTKSAVNPQVISTHNTHKLKVPKQCIFIVRGTLERIIKGPIDTTKFVKARTPQQAIRKSRGLFKQFVPDLKPPPKILKCA